MSHLATTGEDRVDEGKSVLNGLTSGFLKYTSLREKPLWEKTHVTWLEDKRAADDIGDLWRVHDDLYDLSTFAAHHPGGQFWIETTRGHDVTELFETSHCKMTGVPEKLLQKYRVRAATRARTAPYTFHEDGFYRTFKRRVAPILRRVGTGPSWRTRLIADSCLFVFLSTSVAAAVLHSSLLAILSGAALMLTLGTGHNFLHQSDNFRMLYMDVSYFSSAEWRITHAMSHHIYPNTAYDIEAIFFEPLVNFLTDTKSRLSKHLGYVYFHILVLLGFHMEAGKRVLRWLQRKQSPRLENFIPLLHLALMTFAWLVTSSSTPRDTFFGSIWQAFYRVTPLWFTVHLAGSYFFLFAGSMAAHHHPEIYHDGDAALKSADWGLRQLDAVGDRVAMKGNALLVMTTFGDHGLHHLLPTVDHVKLVELYPAFEEVCREFGVKYRYFSLREMMAGMFSQMAKTEARPCSGLMTSDTPVVG